MSKKSDTRLAQKAALLAALGATLLAIAKLILFFASGSLIIALSALDSALDVIVSLINRKIVKFARSDADENHPYGHGRAESIAALGQGCLILGGSIAIIFSSIKQAVYFSDQAHLEQQKVDNWAYVLFFLFASFFSYLISKWLEVNGKKLNSPALLADCEHYRVDLVTNIASSAALALVIFFKNPILDPLIASLFALYIIYSAIKLLKTSINELMDHDISKEIKLSVIKLIHNSDSRVVDVHKLRGRKAGHRYYFDCHVTLPSHLSFNEVHEIIENIEVILQSKYGGDMTIHVDPDNIPKE